MSNTQITKRFTYHRPKFAQFLLLLCLLNLPDFLFAQVGLLDTTFHTGIGANDLVYTTSLQSDGKIIFGGDFTSYNGTAINRIARLNTDGSLDVTFNPGSGVDGGVSSTNIQSDGKIIIAGAFSSYNGIPRNNIVRINQDGTIDLTFNPGIGTNNIIWTTHIQNDGKILIGGNFTSVNGTSINRIARFNADGSIDASFNPGTGANNYVFSISVQNDGKIILGGQFTLFNGIVKNRIIRLNSDGSIDDSFNIGNGANSDVYATIIQNDGQIVFAGDFTSYNGTSIRRIARLNTDGTLDATFNPGTSTNTYIFSLAIQNDGKILIGGEFYIYNGTIRSCLARLNSNGTIDSAFNTGIGADDGVWSISIQNDGKIIIGGFFRTYNGTPKNRIARINSINTGIIENIFDIDLLLFPNPTSGVFALKTTNEEFLLGNLSFVIYNVIGVEIKTSKINSAETKIDLSSQPNGIYYIRLFNEKGSIIKKIVLNK